MNKNFQIWGVRSDLIGDIITALPVLNFLEKEYPGSYKNFSILKKVSQCAPLFFNHPLIDRIKISDFYEGFGEKDIEIANNCSLVLNTRPEVVEPGEWFNKRGHVEESFLMAGFTKEQFDSLSEEQKKPKLERWFDVEKQNKTIGIFPFAGYGQDFHRSPSVKWWNKMVEILKREGYKVFHLGHYTEPTISCTEELCHLSYFSQIELACSCDLTLSTNTGNSWVMGAYGLPQIVISSYHFEQQGNIHNKNPEAMIPVNYNAACISMFDSESCDNIEHEEVLKNIREL